MSHVQYHKIGHVWIETWMQFSELEIGIPFQQFQLHVAGWIIDMHGQALLGQGVIQTSLSCFQRKKLSQLAHSSQQPIISWISKFFFTYTLGAM